MNAQRECAIFLLSVLLALASPWVAAQSTDAFAGVVDEMTPEQRRATGIERLTPEEQKALNHWLQERFAVPAVATPKAPVVPAAPIVAAEAAPTPGAPAVSATASPAPEVAEAAIEAEVARRVAEEVAAAKAAEQSLEDNAPFEATLLPPFDGWRGKTVFKLDNGQIWRQRSKGTYLHRGGDDLRVRFKKNWIGGWEMRLVEADKSVLVKRIK